MSQYKEKMSAREYEGYKTMVENIGRYGQKSDLEKLYTDIRLKYADCDEDLHYIDKKQSNWDMNV